MGKVIQFKNKDQKQLEMDFEQDQVVLDNMTMLNGVESYELDEERNLDMSYMYNDDGLLHGQFDPEDDVE